MQVPAFEHAQYWCAPAVHPLLVGAMGSSRGIGTMQCNPTLAALAYLRDHQARHWLQECQYNL
jgi:hypothetical protein